MFILIQAMVMVCNRFVSLLFDWVNGIFEYYFYITVRYIAVQCVCLIAMFVFVREPGDVIPYCIISVLATNGGNLINVFYVRKYAKIQFTFDMD